MIAMTNVIFIEFAKNKNTKSCDPYAQTVVNAVAGCIPASKISMNFKGNPVKYYLEHPDYTLQQAVKGTQGLLQVNGKTIRVVDRKYKPVDVPVQVMKELRLMVLKGFSGLFDVIVDERRCVIYDSAAFINAAVGSIPLEQRYRFLRKTIQACKVVAPDEITDIARSGISLAPVMLMSESNDVDMKSTLGEILRESGAHGIVFRLIGEIYTARTFEKCFAFDDEQQNFG